MKKGKTIPASNFLVSVYRGDIKSISSCLKKGANIYESVDGYQCLHYAVAKNNANTVDVIKILLEAKANINATDKKGQTPLIHAVKKNNLSATQILLDHGADIAAQDLQGRDVLRHSIISKASGDIIRLLINNGANINSYDSKGTTPLILASKSDNEQAVELFIDRGADIFAKDHEHQSALYYATFNNNLNTLQKLLRAGAFEKQDLSNHNILTDLAFNTGTYFQEGILKNLGTLIEDFDKLTTFMKIVHYLTAYGSNIQINQNIFTFLATYSPSMIYYLATQNPVITLTATANMLYAFLDHIQKIEQIEKSHIDITFAIFEIFTLLTPICIPEELNALKERIYAEAVDKQNWEMQIRIVSKQTAYNLTKNEKGNLINKTNATFPLNTLIPYLQAELSNVSKAKNAFYIIKEINLLRDSIDALNKTEAYKDAFCHLLNQLKQTKHEGELLLTQKQLKYLIPPLTAQVIGSFKLTSKVDLIKVQDLKSFFAPDEEISVLEYETQLSDDTLQFTITLILSYKESCYSHYGQMCQRTLHQLQNLCKTDQIINEEIHFLPPNNKYPFPGDVINKVFTFLTKQEYFQIAVTGKQIFPKLCSKIIEQYNELKQVEHYQQLEEQIQNLNISGDLPNYYTT